MASERKPNLIERLLFGENANKGVQAKGLFPYDATYRYGANSGNDWTSPTPNGTGIFYGGSVDYAVETADLVDNSAVMACLLWICRTFPEARIRIMRRVKGGKPEEVGNHPLTQLMTLPNPFYSGRLMQMPSIVSYNWRGETYLRKVRNGAGQVIRLYYEPHWTCRPIRASADEFISYYQLYRDNKWVDVPIEDIVHIRQGLDPENPMHGLSPLASALREVFTDNAAGRYASSVMQKLGVLGAIVTPKDADTEIADPNRLKAQLQAISTGDERGSYGVFSTPLEFNYPPNDPSKMDTRANRKITEERISGLLGVPAIVAGLGAGLDRSCVPAYARVQTPYGTKTVGEIEAGHIVWSFKDGQIVPRAVTHKWAKGRDRIYEVRTSNRRIRATDNHPFMVRVPGNSQGSNKDRHPSYEWRDLGDLKVGDHIITAKAYPDQGGTMLPDGRPATVGMMQFLGAVIGDGTVSQPGVRIAMPPADRCVEHYKALATSLFTKQANQSGGAIAIQEATPRTQVYIQTRERDFGFSSAMASRQLAVLGVSGRAHTKRVPTWVYGLSRELRLAFLAGIVDTDGHIDKRGVLTITFCNRALVDDVRDLAISLGIRVSSVMHSTILATSLPNAGTKAHYDAWRFAASSAVQVAAIPFTDPLYRERVEANPTRHRGEGFDAHKAGLSSDLGFAEIKAIIPIGEDDVYDLTVEDGHSFFCENTLISNTFANMSEAREMAYESNIIPTQSLWADELSTQLLGDLGDPDTEYVDWDYSKVRVLQDDENKKAARLVMLYAGGLIKRSEGRGDLNYPVTPEDEQYKAAAAPLGAPQPADGMPPPQDATSADAIAKMLLLPEGKAGLPKPAENLAGRMAADIEAEVMRMYVEAAGKVG